jgi:hypothetical protein
MSGSGWRVVAVGRPAANRDGNDLAPGLKYIDSYELDPEYPSEAEAQMDSERLVPKLPEPAGPLHLMACLRSNFRQISTTGMFEISIQIPYEFRDQAIALLSFEAIPMEMYVRPYRQPHYRMLTASEAS